MIANQRVISALEILNEFKVLDIPLSRFLSGWFKAHPKAGSRDRRILNDLLYSYYRAYHLIQGLELREKMIAAYFLMGNTEQGVMELVQAEKPESEATITFQENTDFETRKSILEKIYPSLIWGTVFPWKDLLSSKMSWENLEFSLVHQPRVFIRIHEAYTNALKKALLEKAISYEEMNPICLAFDSRTNLNGLKEGDLKSAFEIQDFSSQATGQFFQAKARSNWWDCCAGGGGKSLLLSQLYPGANLWASDSRYSVLSNLEQRFMESGFPPPRTFVQDLLSDENLPVRESFFDGIVYDAPCTGSGTWSRTPERLGNFHPASLGRITDIQRRIGDKIFPYLNPKGYLIYITCSVFKAENEDIVQYLTERYPLKLEKQIYLDGTKIGADTLFVARLRKGIG